MAMVQGTERVCGELSRVAEYLRTAVAHFASMAELPETTASEKRKLERELREKDAEVKDLRASLESATERVQAHAAKVAVLEAKVAAAKSREAEMMVSQAGVIQAVVEKVLRSNCFFALASVLGSLLSIHVKADTLDAVAKEYPNVDKFVFGYERRTDEEQLASYAAAVIDFAGSSPLLKKLCSSAELLTPEIVMACEEEKCTDLVKVIAELGSDGEEEEEETANVEVEQQRTEQGPEGDQGGVSGSLP